jgi:hypothetical protein
MTIEERLKMLLGEKDFAIASLSAQLEMAQARVKELETEYKATPKANGKDEQLTAN